MSVKVALLKAVRDQLKASVTGVQSRVYVVVQDAEGNQMLPTEAVCPFLAVSDDGMESEYAPGRTERQDYRVRVRAYVQDLRDAETPVLGHTASSSLGAAELQDLIADALQNNLLATRIAGVELAQVESQPAVDTVADEAWFAVIGDVRMLYHMTEAL
jgi:hypothetical protein